jgi:uncharacterized damage-inducible protein DinB
MVEYFRRLFSFDAWANQEVLAALEKAENPPARSVGLLAHILSAQGLWLERLKQEPQSVPVWPQTDLGRCRKQAMEMSHLWNAYLNDRSTLGLEDTVEYKNTKGEPFSSRIDDVLMHVIMHSVYHRGQIASDMRAAGLAPAYTDFIHGVRQGFFK